MDRTEPLEFEMTPATRPASRTRRIAARGLGIGAIPQAHRQVVAAPPARDRVDLRVVGDRQVLEQVAEVAPVRDRALGGAGAGREMPIKPHPRAQLRFLHLLRAGGAPARAQVVGDDTVVHAQEGIAGVEDDGADGPARG
jgi:hypothetical protein